MSSSTTDKGKAIQTEAPNVPIDPLLFYIRDHELYYTACHGPRYNEYAIFIDYHEWYLSANTSFFQYLKIINAYRALLQTVNKHPVVIILATGYVESWRLFRHYSSGNNYLTYWKDHELCILRFVLKVIPDAHICPLDFLSYQMQFLSTISQLQIYMQKTCLQMSHFASQCAYHHLSYCSCYQLAHYELQCKILQKYATSSLSSKFNESKSLVPKSKPNLQQFVLQKFLDKQGKLNKQTNSDDETMSSASSLSPLKPEDFQDSQDPYEL